MPEILPCPFCGQQPQFPKHFKHEMWQLIHRCPIVGTLHMGWTEDYCSLIDAWNTRHKPTQPEEE